MKCLMVNGLSSVYHELECGELEIVQDLFAHKDIKVNHHTQH